MAQPNGMEPPSQVQSQPDNVRLMSSDRTLSDIQCSVVAIEKDVERLRSDHDEFRRELKESVGKIQDRLANLDSWKAWMKGLFAAIIGAALFLGWVIDRAAKMYETSKEKEKPAQVLVVPSPVAPAPYVSPGPGVEKK